MLRTAALFAILFTTFTFAEEQYPYGPDSERHDAVPHGTVQKYKFTSPKIFEGTERDAWVYIPAQYAGDKPAAVMIYQDGAMYVKDTGEWRAPLVMDNLIAQKSMPVTIGIFLQPGQIPAAQHQVSRNNRSYEYDSPTDRYARFLIEEVLPDVQTRFNVNLSNDPNLRGLCGASSGGICAFNAAWQRTDAFRRVISVVGSFTSLHGGGNDLSFLVRKNEPKPIRVFLEDGDADLDNFAGSWPLANREMDAALTFAGNEHQLVIRKGAHNSKHGGPLLPDMLKFVWNNFHKPIEVPVNKTQPVEQIIVAGDEWKAVAQASTEINGLTADKDGNVFYSADKKIWKVSEGGKPDVFCDQRSGALAAAPDGQLIAVNDVFKTWGLVAYDAAGKMHDVKDGAAGEYLCVDHHGKIFATNPRDNGITVVSGENEQKFVVRFACTGIAFTPDQGQLAIADPNSPNIHAFRVESDGLITCDAPYYTAHVPAGESGSGAQGLCFDTKGQLYAATTLGIQIFSPAGAVVAIISNPSLAPPTQMTFAGPKFDTLYVASGNTLFKRKTQATGVFGWQEPSLPVKPKR